jgi:VIT1/CCC1 family predicted Fe2+/Mn2+ transporter
LTTVTESGGQQDDLKQAVFGGFDGCVSALGVVTGLVVAGTHSGSHILAAALGLAIAATVGMGAGEYLSDVTRSLRRAAVMAAATLTGSLTPALPFAFGYGTGQIVACGVIVCGSGVLIGHFRGYRLTFTVLAIVCGLTVALSALVA